MITLTNTPEEYMKCLRLYTPDSVKHCKILAMPLGINLNHMVSPFFKGKKKWLRSGNSIWFQAAVTLHV